MSRVKTKLTNESSAKEVINEEFQRITLWSLYDLYNPEKIFYPKTRIYDELQTEEDKTTKFNTPLANYYLENYIENILKTDLFLNFQEKLIIITPEIVSKSNEIELNFIPIKNQNNNIQQTSSKIHIGETIY